MRACWKFLLLSRPFRVCVCVCSHGMCLGNTEVSNLRYRVSGSSHLVLLRQALSLAWNPPCMVGRWAREPSDPPISANPAVGLQACTATSSISTWVLGTEPGSSRLPGKHFTHRALFPALASLSFRTRHGILCRLVVLFTVLLICVNPWPMSPTPLILFVIVT